MTCCYIRWFMFLDDPAQDATRGLATMTAVAREEELSKTEGVWAGGP